MCYNFRFLKTSIEVIFSNKDELAINCVRKSCAFLVELRRRSDFRQEADTYRSVRLDALKILGRERVKPSVEIGESNPNQFPYKK